MQRPFRCLSNGEQFRFSALFVGQGDATRHELLGEAEKLRFSALFVGQGDATLSSFGMKWMMKVSVPSSLGREMQRFNRTRTIAHAVGFQCPLRWAGRCNGWQTSAQEGRLEFQCPLRWAGRCNKKGKRGPNENQNVSVPSSLGREMQRWAVGYSWVRSSRFQCPLRWAGRCNGDVFIFFASSAGGFSALFVGQGDATN